MNKLFARASLLVAVCLMLPTNGWSSPLFETLGDVQGSGGLNARFSAGGGSAAAYFNPAMLSAAPDSIDIGFTVFQQVMNFTYFARGSGVDVTDQIAGQSLRIGGNDGPVWQQTTLPTSFLEGTYEVAGEPREPIPPRQRGYFNGTGDVINLATVGLTINVVPEFLVAGLYAYIPLGEYTSVSSWFSDERDQYFTNSLHATLYEDRMRAPTLALGVASNPIEQLRIGLAFTLALKATAGAGAYAPTATEFEDTIQLATDVGVIAKVAPHFSVVYEPLEELSLSFTAHSPSKFEIDTQFSAMFTTGGATEDSATRTSVHDYNPWILGLGAEYRLGLGNGDMELGLSAGVRYEFWSNYQDRQGRTPEGRYEWSNTLIPSFSAILSDEKYEVGVSGIYVPSPVPEQTGRTNYADNDRLGGTLTGSYKFRIVTLPIEFGVQFSAHTFIEREHEKIDPDPGRFSPGSLADLVRDELPDNLTRLTDEEKQGLQTNNPGWPGYSHDGQIWSAGAFLKIRY